jgi:hypothetical protein
MVLLKFQIRNSKNFSFRLLRTTTSSDTNASTMTMVAIAGDAGERTRLACWRGRPCHSEFFTMNDVRKTPFGEAPKGVRQSRCTLQK